MANVKNEQTVLIQSEPLISQSKSMTNGKKREYKSLTESHDVPDEEKIKVKIVPLMN